MSFLAADRELTRRSYHDATAERPRPSSRERPITD
jgi:hypothetical protein